MADTLTTVSQPNPLLNTHYVTEVGGFILVIAAIFTLIVKWLNKRRDDDIRLHDGEHALVNREIADLKHDLRNERARTDALETRDNEKEVRLVKMELGIENFKAGQERIEAMLDKRLDSIEKSIREVREVKPKG